MENVVIRHYKNVPLEYSAMKDKCYERYVDEEFHVGDKWRSSPLAFLNHFDRITDLLAHSFAVLILVLPTCSETMKSKGK